MMSKKLLVLMLGLGLLAAAAVAHAQESSLGAEASAPVAESSAPVAESSAPVETHEASAQSTDNKKTGAKITIISNSNVLNSVSKKSDGGNVHKAMEADNKSAQEEHQKKQYENQRQDAAEDKKKQQVKEERAKEVEAEEKKKKEEREKEEAKKAEEKQKEQAQKQQAEQAQKQQAEQDGKKQEAAQKQQAEAAQKQQEEQRQKAAQSIRLVGDWAAHGGGYEQPIASLQFHNEQCWLHGLLVGTLGHIGQLPGGCRPTQGHIMFVMMRAGRPTRVDIDPNGNIYAHTGVGGRTWTSLDGISFDVNIQSTVIGLSNSEPKHWGWTAYGHGWRDTTQSNRGGFCQVSGLIRVVHGGWGALGQTQGNCRPSERLIFSGMNHESANRVDILPNGVFYYCGGAHNHGWIGLDNMAFTVGGGQGLSLFNGWHNYHNSYRTARFERVGNICVLSGLINNGGGWSGHITNLPSGCRPRARLIFGGNVHTQQARIDILPDGQVHYVESQGGTHWLSISGIRFIAFQ